MVVVAAIAWCLSCSFAHVANPLVGVPQHWTMGRSFIGDLWTFGVP